MYPTLFTLCVLLLVICTLAIFIADRRLSTWVRELGVTARPPGIPSEDVPLRYAFWLMGGELAATVIRFVMVVSFAMLAGCMAWMALFHLVTGWSIAYLILGFFSAVTLLWFSDGKTPSFSYMGLLVILLMVWVFLHLLGLTHIDITSFHVDFHTPRIRFTIP